MIDGTSYGLWGLDEIDKMEVFSNLGCIKTRGGRDIGIELVFSHNGSPNSCNDFASLNRSTCKHATTLNQGWTNFHTRIIPTRCLIAFWGHDTSSFHAARTPQAWTNGRGSFTVGLMFWLSEKKLVGSYWFLSATNRS